MSPESFLNELTTESKSIVEKILKKYPPGQERAGLREILYYLFPQEINFHQRKNILQELAYLCGVSQRFLMEIVRNDLGYKKSEEEIAYTIEVCTSLSCLLRGGGDVMKACEKWLGLPCGGSTVDGQFSLRQKTCFNRCTSGPMVKINEQLKEELTPTKMVFWLQNLTGEGKVSSSEAGTVVRNPYASPSEVE